MSRLLWVSVSTDDATVDDAFVAGLAGAFVAAALTGVFFAVVFAVVFLAAGLAGAFLAVLTV